MSGWWSDKANKRGHTIRLSDLDWHALEYLAFHMRQIDRDEIFGNLPTDNPIEFAAMVFQQTAQKGFGWLGWLNESPKAAAGLFENFPGCWQIWSFGAPGCEFVWSELYRKLWGSIPAARDLGLHRLEAKSSMSHTETHRLLRLARFECEARLRRYGKGGEDYLLFARTWEPVHGQVGVTPARAVGKQSSGQTCLDDQGNQHAEQSEQRQEVA